MEKNKLIEVKNLSVKYSSKTPVFGGKRNYNTAVDDVSFDLYNGEVLGIAGESGSGKTTIARCLLNILGYVDKSSFVSGNILFKGYDLLKINKNDLKQARKNIQGIFQDPDSSLNEIYTVSDIIGEPLKYLTDFTKRERDAIKADVMKKCGFNEDDSYKYPNEFSTGQKQRICIARAIVTEPKILVADEPLSSLDISIQAQIINLFLDLREKYNLSIIFITHDLNILKVFCDRIIVMKDGKIVEQGNTAEVMSNPKHKYTQTLISSVI